MNKPKAAKSFPLLLRNSRVILMAGFGGLLALMAFSGIDAMRLLREIQQRNDAIRGDFMNRNRLLNQIRSDVYLSGTYVRDYLLEPEPQNAARHRGSLESTRRDMDAALQRYAGMLSPEETHPYGTLQRELADYWHVLEPALQWNVDQRRARGYEFLRDEVLPRRLAMLSIADQIAAVNERQLNSGNTQVARLFTQFQVRLAITVFVTLGLGLLLAAFCMRKILNLERESGARFLEIAHARSELKDLSARLVEAQESERRAISRELHDEVGQSLSALLVGLSNLAAAIPPAVSAELQRHVEGIRKLAENSMGVVRNITLLLRPSMLDDLGLVPALQWQAREVSKRTGMHVNVAVEGVSDDLPEQHKTSVYRVVQEALNNCARHAGAKTVRIIVRQGADRLMLSIHDDGRGFQPDLTRGLGLLGIEERVTHLGGSFEIDSEPGRGTLIAISLPLVEQPYEAKI
jgi:signal transduction histidine kinase